jgi:hypothetical protein
MPPSGTLAPHPDCRVCAAAAAVLPRPLATPSHPLPPSALTSAWSFVAGRIALVGSCRRLTHLTADVPPHPPPAPPLPMRASSASLPSHLAPPRHPLPPGMATTSPPGKDGHTSLRLGCPRATYSLRITWCSPSWITLRLSQTSLHSSVPLSGLRAPTSMSSSSHLHGGSSSCGSPTAQTGSGCEPSAPSDLRGRPLPWSARRIPLTGYPHPRMVGSGGPH